MLYSVVLANSALKYISPTLAWKWQIDNLVQINNNLGLGFAMFRINSLKFCPPPSPPHPVRNTHFLFLFCFYQKIKTLTPQKDNPVW